MKSTEHTVLVTGGAGFIGSHVVERLIQSGHRVVNLDLLTYAGNLDNLATVADHERYAFVQGDICDGGLVKNLLAKHRPTIVFNIAAESHVDRSIDDASAFIETNVTGVYRMLEASLAYWRSLSDENKTKFRFIQMSTDEVYGSIAEGAFTEDSNYAPNSPYAASKAAGDHMVRAYATTYALPVILVHASNTYGPRQYPEKLIPHMIISALQSRPLPVYGQGLNVRDWMYVGDLARGLECVVMQGLPGEIYNFAGCDERRNIDTVRSLCMHLDRLTSATRPCESTITYVADRPGHDFRYAMAIDKVKRIFGWEPQTRFSEELPRVISWYLENRIWWQSILDRGYGAMRIGLRSLK
jgi:dTDP-glucose 4,6-dehydratase